MRRLIRMQLAQVLVVFASLLLGIARPDDCQVISINVGSGGINKESCLAQDKRCESLDYVLKNLQNINTVGTCSQLVINVESHCLDLGLAVANMTGISRLTISSFHNNSRANISCNGQTGLYFQGTSLNQLVLKGLSFNGCQNENFFIKVENFETVEMEDCSVTSCAPVKLEVIEHGTIKNCLFTNSQIVGEPYSSFALESDCHNLLVERSIFIDNDPRGGLGLRNCNKSMNTINECIFNHNLPGLQLGRDFSNQFSANCSQFLLLEQTTFTRNPRALFLFSSISSEITVNSTRNKFIKRGNLFQLGGAAVIHPSPLSALNISFNSDSFIGNESPFGGMIWYNSNSQDLTDIAMVSTKFVNCTFMENKASDGSVLYSNVKSPNIAFKFYNCDVSNNQLIFGENTVLSAGIVHIQGGHLLLSNCQLANNLGTALVIDSSLISFEGTVIFSNNIGILGGAIHWLESVSIVSSSDNAPSVLLSRNTAARGGAIYFGKIGNVSQQTSNFPTFNLVDNTAEYYGHSLFFEDPTSIDSFNTIWGSAFTISNSLSPVNQQNASSATYIKSMNKEISVFPGEQISIDLLVTDYWKQNSSCDAQFAVICDGVVCRRDIQPNLIGSSRYAPLLYVQAITPGHQTTTLKLLSMEDSLSTSLQLVFWCGYTANNVSLTVNLTSCPEGFEYNPNTRMCVCQDNSTNTVCSVELGAVCIRNGYWFGYLPDSEANSTQIIAPCDPVLCSFQLSRQCPTDIISDSSIQYFILPKVDLDNQCQENHGGFLCYGCRNGYQFTFQARKCVANTHCHIWQSVLLILFTIAFQLAIIAFIVVVIRMKLKVGSGILYGPLLTLAVTNLLITSCHSQNISALQQIATTVSSLLQLNPEFFGVLSWCFVENFGRLENTAFRYISPVMICLSLLLLACVARRFPKVLSAFQRTPVQLTCLLLLLTFWSLTETTSMLLIPTIIPGVPGIRVSTDPSVSYFQGKHIFLALIAIVVALFCITPLAIILLVSPFFRAKFHRISPLLDEFQSCYKDRYRWYSSVYFISWIAISVTHQLYNPAVKLELLVLTMLHLLLQPYIDRRLNTLDNILLTNLVLLSSLTNSDNCAVSSPVTVATVLIYFLVLLLISVIPCGLILLLVHRCYRGIKRVKAQKRSDSTGNETGLLNNYVFVKCDDVPQPQSGAVTKSLISLDDFNDSVEEREPIISQVQSSNNH